MHPVQRPTKWQRALIFRFSNVFKGNRSVAVQIAGIVGISGLLVQLGGDPKQINAVYIAVAVDIPGNSCRPVHAFHPERPVRRVIRRLQSVRDVTFGIGLCGFTEAGWKTGDGSWLIACYPAGQKMVVSIGELLSAPEKRSVDAEIGVGDQSRCSGFFV